MSEDNEVTAQAEDQQPQGEDQTSETIEPERTAETDWKAMARKWEKQANLDKDDAFKWREYVKSQKPAEERIAEELKTAQAELEQERSARLRYEIATERGITGDALGLLDGNTREEIESKADAILALVANQAKPKTPKPDDQQGRSTGGGSSTAEQFATALGSII